MLSERSGEGIGAVESHKSITDARRLVDDIGAQLQGFLSDSDHVRAIQRLYELQRADGGWGPSASQDRACFTAQAIDGIARVAIRSSNLPLLSRYVSEGSPGKTSSEQQIVRGINWLLTHQAEEGRWGADTWDTGLVIKTLINLGFDKSLDAIEHATSWICDVAAETDFQTSEFWAGPAQAAAAMEVLLTLDRDDRPFQKARELLLDRGPLSADKEGRFGYGKPAGWEWHTAAVIVALESYTDYSAKDDFERSVEALKKAQSKEGYWGHPPVQEFTTYLAAKAMESRKKGSPQAKDALDWFRSELENQDFENSSMVFMCAYTHAALEGTPPVAIKSSTIQELIDHYVTPLSVHVESIDQELIAATAARLERDGLTTEIHLLEDEVTGLREQNRHLRWNRVVQICVAVAAVAALILALLSIVGRSTA